VGKTRLARALAAEYGTTVVEAMGYSTRLDLATKFSSLKLGDFLLIDECHRLGGLEQEMLCEAIDKLSIPNITPVGNKKASRAERIDLPSWTLILATDQPGKLLDALVKRMVIQVELALYPIRELKEIVEAMAGEENMLLSPHAARLLAKVSGGRPRKAKLLLQNLLLHYPDSEEKQLGLPEVRQFLKAFGIDRSGLGRMERRYLKTLSRRGSASLESLAITLGTDPAFLKKQVEAPLVRRGLVGIFAGGRRLTTRGEQRLRPSGISKNAREEAAHVEGEGRQTAN
jgi:Holliday junction DNA helicase RuvB